MSTEQAERIRLARRNKNMSQEKLALFVGVTKSAVSRWENGSSPDDERLSVIADALGVQEQWLAGYGDREPITRTPGGDSPEAALIGASMLDWATALRVAKILLACPEAENLSQAQQMDTLKRCYVVAVREPSKLTDALVAGMALSNT
jgi:transcriptional regulator with XRE-family HTH domain